MKQVLKSGCRVYSPKWDMHESIGRLTVIATPRHGIAQKGKKMWIYVCQCACGQIETLNQDQLNGGRVDCMQCLKKRRVTTDPVKWYLASELPPDVPDFATMPAPSLVGKPEQY